MNQKKHLDLRGGIKRVAITLIFIMIPVFIMGSRTNIEFTNEIIAFVDSEPIYLEEFESIAIHEELTKTYIYFSEKYGVKDYRNFFETSFNNESPLEFLKQNTLKNCISTKVEQLMAKEKGIWRDIDYPTFLQGLERENEYRKQALEKGEVIYGLREYNSYEYYQYLLANKREQLKEFLQSEWNITIKELKEHYEGTKHEYKLEDEIIVEMLYKEVNPSNIIHIADEMNAMKKSIKDEEGLESLKERWEEKLEKPIYMTYTFKSENNKLDYRLYEPIMIRLEDTGVGEISELIKNGDHLVFYKVLDKKEGGYYSYEEVEQDVYNDYISVQYNKLLSNKIEQSNIIINTEIYDHFKIEDLQKEDKNNGS